MVALRQRFTLRLAHGRSLALGERTLVMGILNVTPDSFSDGGRHDDVGAAVAAGLAMAEAGADLIDVGGESTRPGASPVDAATERARVVPVLSALARQLAIPLSIDTTKADVAAAAVDAGASVINDISGLRYDARVADVAASTGAALVLMHMRGHSSEMYRHATYAHVVADVADELAWSVAKARAAGVAHEALVLDPGIGFAKKAEHSWTLLARLDAPVWQAFELPLLVGASRKSFLQTATGERPAIDRDPASHAAAVVAALGGAHMIRVHDVAGSVQAVGVADMIRVAAVSGSS